MDFPEADVFALAVSSADGAVYAGTEPLDSFPYALAMNSRLLFAGLRDGRIYQSDYLAATEKFVRT